MADETNIEVKIKDKRLSFFNGFTPQEGTDDDGNLTRYNYNTNILIPKDDPIVAEIKAAMQKVKKAAWGDNPPKLASDKLCLRDGEPVDEDSGERLALYEGYQGHFYIVASKSVKPEEYEKIKAGKKTRPISIIGPKKGANGKFRELEEGDEFAPFSGSYANIIIRIWAYKGDPAKKRPPRINASLEAVQWKREGEAFGARRVDVNSAFDEEDDDEIGGTSSSSSVDEEDDDLDIG